MATDFSRTLSLLRQEKGVSQRKAAAELGISQALLSHYENGIREPGLAFVTRACDYYHVSADYLLGRTLSRDGSIIEAGDVYDSSGEKGSLRGSIMATLQKKLVVNTTNLLFDLLGKTGNRSAITAAGDAMTALGISFTQVTRDTNIIAQVLAGESTVTSVFTADQLNTITEFGQHMDFFGIDLTRVPQYSLAADNLPLLIFPILAVVTMFISTHISMKASGQEMQGSMKLTMYMMPLMYVFFCFTVPCAFSLYYVISNIVMTVQTQVMRKIYDPEKMRKEVEAQIEEKKKQQKRGVKSTTVKVTDPKTGKVTEKNLSASEMNKCRLEYARKLDAERYKDERTVPLSELNKQDKE